MKRTIKFENSISSNRCYVGSEIGQLKRVIVHDPQLALQRLTPSNNTAFLFDDILDINTAIKEHKEFCNILKTEKVEIFFLQDLLIDILQNEDVKKWLLNIYCSSNYLGTISDEIKKFLKKLPETKIAEYLISGILWKDFNSSMINSLVAQIATTTDFAIPPLPNLFFTRDASTWIYNGVSLNLMAKSARKRETAILSAIYKFHHLFTNCDFNFWHDESYEYDNHVFLEGGDILVIGNGCIMIGVGERTSPQGIEKLSKMLFHKNVAEKVIVAELPKERSYIHLDSIFTMLDKDCFVFYPPVVNTMRIWQITPNNSKNLCIKEIKEGFFDYLAKELNHKELRLIPTGGDSFQIEREQWNAANNMLAIRPGVVIGYEHNYYTIENMRKLGIKVLTFPGLELSRGRGGTRCMTCPFERDDM